MRILIATDGSQQAARACELGRTLALRSEADIRFVAVLPPISDLLDGAWPGAITVDPEPVERAAEEQLQAWLRQEVDRTAGWLSHEVTQTPADGRASGVLLRGAPAEQIITEASTWRADLIVVGSRGRGTLKSALFGSVSEQVIDRARVPVLVGRRETLQAAIVAVDASSAAHAAVDYVARSPIFRGLEATVVGVAPGVFAWWFGLVDGDTASLDAVYRAQDEAERTEEAAARDAAATLRAAGLRVTTRVVTGHPTDEVSRLAADLGADTIVIGTRGMTGVKRLLTGSVTRGVLHHSGCSVLVVHDGPTTGATPTNVKPESVGREPASARSEP